ncbi:hypothetical protein D3C86_1808470 [compost metagenome]
MPVLQAVAIAPGERSPRKAQGGLQVDAVLLLEDPPGLPPGIGRDVHADHQEGRQLPEGPQPKRELVEPFCPVARVGHEAQALGKGPLARREGEPHLDAVP